jgi:hypothetical protein
MFAVSATETIDLATLVGLVLLHQDERPDRLGRTGVNWSYLTFQKYAKDPS